jgi:alcohol dehydrogenase (NADP+)
MPIVFACSVDGPDSPFKMTTVERREPGSHDVVIAIAYCGVCQTDIHVARNSAVPPPYPLVPGHEIAGIVESVGGGVTKFAVGDRVGVGCMVDSCRVCDRCRAGLEHFCREGYTATYGRVGRDGVVTAGGYSQSIVVDQDFVVSIPECLSLAGAAPLMCAGVTMYSPMRHWKVGPGSSVGIVGFGGLGHVGVQLSRALGARTVVLDLSPEKEPDALRLGADEYHVVADLPSLERLADSLDLIICAVPAKLDLDAYLRMLKFDGTFVQIGATSQPMSVAPSSLWYARATIAGSKIGGMAETQEVIDFCAEHGIEAEVEVIGADDLGEAFARVLAGDVRFRFVIDMATLG